MDKAISGTRAESGLSSSAKGRRWLTLEQLLEVLPLKRSRIYYLTHTRQIPFRKIGRTLLFDLAEIQKWLEGSGNGNDPGISD
ncbi:MAG: helix-turn-helix domain-containing protein [Acidobacteria bacterium]|nr:helix-turn-helix domain-containing protein [Acidobacteriota bacterium]